MTLYEVTPATAMCGIVILVILFVCWLADRKWIVVDIIAWILGGLIFLVLVGPTLAYVFLK